MRLSGGQDSAVRARHDVAVPREDDAREERWSGVEDRDLAKPL